MFSKILGAEQACQDRRDLDQIAAILGYLPLALSITASRLAYEPEWATAEFLARLRQDKDRLTLLTYDNQNVRRSFDSSYKTISSNLQSFFTGLTRFDCRKFSAEMAAHVHNLSLEIAQDYFKEVA